MKPLRICIIGLKCYDHIAQRPVPRYLGGIETQLVVLARGLAAAGCTVSMITYDHGQPDKEVFGSVVIHKSYVPGSGLPLLRPLHPRFTRLWGAMRRASADIYIQMGAGYETGQVALGCRLMCRRPSFVFCLASDANFGVHLRIGRLGIEGRIYRYGLRRAKLVLAQTKHQQAGLLKATGIAAQIIPMAIVPPTESIHAANTAIPRRVLWIGRVTREKRLDWLLDLARRLPELTFDIVGAPNTASHYATDLIESAKALANVRVHGRAPTSVITRLYSEAGVLCCTSALEGFPTTFLEAWSCGLPVVTTFDPDGIVEAHGLGRVAHDADSLASSLHGLLCDRRAYMSASDAARRYFRENHSVDGVCKLFLRAFAVQMNMHRSNMA